MSRMPKRPSSTKPAITSGDLRKSETQPVFSEGAFPLSEPVTQSCPDVLFNTSTSLASVKKKNPYYVIDFYPNAEWGSEAIVTRVADRLLRYSHEHLLQKIPADRLSRTELLNGMVGVKKINRDDQSEIQFKLIKSGDSLLWKKVESADELLPYEKLLYGSCDFRTATLIMQDYWDKLKEAYVQQENMDQLSEKLLSCDIVLKNKAEADFFFNDNHVKKILAVFQAFDLLGVSITKELWPLLYELQIRDSLMPYNLRALVSLSANLYSQVVDEITKISQDALPVFLPAIVRKIGLIDKSVSPLVLSASSSSSLERPVPQPANSSGLGDALGRANQSSQFLSVRSMTLFPRTPNASPSGVNSKSPKISDFSPMRSPRDFK